MTDSSMDLGQAIHTLGLDQYVPIFLAIHAIASFLDAVIPQPAPASHWVPVRKILSVLALNVGHATDAAQPAITTWLSRVSVILKPTTVDAPGLSQPSPTIPVVSVGEPVTRLRRPSNPPPA